MFGYLAVGTTVVRVIGSYPDLETAAAVAARLNSPVDTPLPFPGLVTSRTHQEHLNDGKAVERGCSICLQRVDL